MPDDHLTGLFPISEISDHLPRPASKSTVNRWRRDGINGRRLEVVKIGGRIFTSRDRLLRFIGGETTASE